MSVGIDEKTFGQHLGGDAVPCRASAKTMNNTFHNLTSVKQKVTNFLLFVLLLARIPIGSSTFVTPPVGVYFQLGDN